MEIKSRKTEHEKEDEMTKEWEKERKRHKLYYDAVKLMDWKVPTSNLVKTIRYGKFLTSPGNLYRVPWYGETFLKPLWTPLVCYCHFF